MEETIIAQDVLLLCEDRKAAAWIEAIIEEANEGPVEWQGDAWIRNRMDDLHHLSTALVFASDLGDELTLAIEVLRATHHDIYIMLFTEEASLDIARRSVEIGVDEYFTSYCSTGVIRSILSREMSVELA